jgi:hypothetical protein
MSSVAAKCNKPKGRHHQVEGYTIYYGRDRGDEDAAGLVGNTLAAVCSKPDGWIDIVYLFDKGKWWSVSGDGPKYKRTDLRKILAEEAKSESETETSTGGARAVARAVRFRRRIAGDLCRD